MMIIFYTGTDDSTCVEKDVQQYEEWSISRDVWDNILVLCFFIKFAYKTMFFLVVYRDFQ